MSSLLRDDPHWLHWVNVYGFADNYLFFRTDRHADIIFNPCLTLEAYKNGEWLVPISSVWQATNRMLVHYAETVPVPTYWRYRYPSYGYTVPPDEFWYPDAGVVSYGPF